MRSDRFVSPRLVGSGRFSSPARVRSSRLNRRFCDAPSSARRPVTAESLGRSPPVASSIEGIREFAQGETHGPVAFPRHGGACRCTEAGNPAATATARAAGSAAASAYTHPLADVQQTKHIVGAAAYAALALHSTTMAIQGSPTTRSAGQSSTPPLPRAPFCSRCPLVKPVRAGWTRSSMR